MDNGIQNLDDQHYLHKIESDAAIDGATWEGALKEANTEFVLNEEDAAKQMSGPLSFFGKAAGLLINGAFASGGPITAPGSYLVGERGAEIVSIGASSGYVTPNTS